MCHFVFIYNVVSENYKLPNYPSREGGGGPWPAQGLICMWLPKEWGGNNTLEKKIIKHYLFFILQSRCSSFKHGKKCNCFK